MLTPVTFGGLAVLDADELVPFDGAIECINCITDDDTVYGRPGYRSALAGAIASSGSSQGLWRYQYGPSSYRMVSVVSGEIFVSTDPSSEVLSDGAATSLGVKFGATAKISGAQLNNEFYLATDELNVPWQRIKSDLSLQSLQSFPQGSKPSATKGSSPTFVLFKDLTAPTITGTAVFGTSGVPAGATNWRSVTKTGADDDPLTGITVLFKLAADFDARAYNWLAISITPRDTNNTNGQVDIQMGRDVATVATDLTLVGEVHDVPPIGGSPNLVWIDLAKLPSAVRSAVRYIKFVLSGATGGKFAVHGYCFAPSRPLLSPEKYYVTFQDSATLQESLPTEALEVTVADSDITMPTYPDCYLDRGSFKSNGASDDLLSQGNHRIFNREYGAAMPALSDIGLTIRIDGTDPAITGPDTTRLWKDTENGRRLVNTAAYGGSGASYQIYDNGGLSVLANALFKPGGTPPQATSLAAVPGRLVAGYQNRFYYSSFVPPAATSSPIPQFPAIAIDDFDGWAADISAANTEQIQNLVWGGDALYIATNKNLRMMRQYTPDSRVFFVYGRGIVSRAGGLFADETYFWPSWDGVYASRNQAGGFEMSEAARRYYISWLLPDSTTVIGYQNRKLYVTRGTRQMRYDFVKRRWSRHTLAHTFLYSAQWYDVGQTIQQLWFLTSDRKIARWQDAATSDMMVGSAAGTAIPNWEYQTGYAVLGVKSTPAWIYCDRTATVKVYIHKDAQAAQLEKPFGGSGETEYRTGLSEAQKWRIRVTGAHGAKLRRLMWELHPTAGRGG